MISSILHRHKDIPPLSLDSSLRGVVLVSPWVSFSTDAKSFEENKDKDMFVAAFSVEWADDFATPEERDNYSEPIRADASWWKGTPVEKALMVAGDDELFRDDITRFAGTLKQAGVDLEFVNCPSQIHVDCHLDASTGMEPGVMSTSIWAWLETLF